MKKGFCFLLLLLSAGFLTALHAQNIFLKAKAPKAGDLGGMIIGNVTQAGHEKEVGVLSYSWGIAGCDPNINSNGSGACKASPSDFTFMTEFSPGVNQLRYMIFTGTKLQSADFVFEKNGGNGTAYTYYKVHMEDITVTSVQESGSFDIPTVSVSLAATRIAWAIYQQDNTGQTVLINKTGFNLATNTVWNYSF